MWKTQAPYQLHRLDYTAYSTINSLSSSVIIPIWERRQGYEHCQEIFQKLKLYLNILCLIQSEDVTRTSECIDQLPDDCGFPWDTAMAVSAAHISYLDAV